MPNAVKGEAPLSLGGRDYVLVSDMEARILAEGLYGKPYPEIIDDANANYLGAIRALLYGMLKRRQPKITPEETSDILEQFMDEIGPALVAASEAAAAKASEDGEGENPPRRRSGKTSGDNGAKSGSTRKPSGKQPRARSK